MRSARHVVVGLVAGAALTLSGCSVAGEVVVGDQETALDLVLTIASDQFAPGRSPCDRGFSGLPLTVSERTEQGDTIACRISGVVPHDPEQRGWLVTGSVTESGGYRFLTLPGDAWPVIDELDVTVVFPGGEVVAATGEVDGDRIRWRDADAVRTAGLAATVRTGPAVPGWLVPGALGLGLGLALVVGVRALALALVGRTDAPPDPIHGYPRRRKGLPFRRTVVAAPPSAEGSSLAPAPLPRPTASDPGDTSEWAP